MSVFSSDKTQGQSLLFAAIKLGFGQSYRTCFLAAEEVTLLVIATQTCLSGN